MTQRESGIDHNHSSGLESFEYQIWQTLARHHVGRATQNALAPEILRLVRVYLGIDVTRPGGGHATRRFAGGNLRHYFPAPDYTQVSRCGRIPRDRLQENRIFEDWDKFQDDVLACAHCLKSGQTDPANLTDAKLSDTLMVTRKEVRAMEVVIGLFLGLGIAIWIGCIVRGIFRTATRVVTREVDISRGNVPASADQIRSARQSGRAVTRSAHRTPRPQFTQDELDYFAAHVPASAGKQRPLPGAGRIDLRNTTEKDR